MPFTALGLASVEPILSGCVDMAFHAVIIDETVWSAGSGFSGRNWATYI